MIKPIISIIIPSYNSAKTLNFCLKSVQSSAYKNFEIILVDDKSMDNSINIAKKYPEVKIIRLKQNLGPANARNIGAKNARGQVLVFIDSDVVIEKESLSRIIKDFRKYKSIIAVDGLYSKIPANKGLFSRYLALQKYYNFSRSGKYFSHPTTAFFGIKKDVFIKYNGFNPTYKEMEDYELGFRIAEEEKILLDKRLTCKHFFPSFIICAKKYFIRTQYWMDLFLKHKRFSTGIATRERGFSSIFTLLSTFFLCSIFFNSKALYLFIPFFLLSFNADKGFFKFTYSQKGLFFMIYSIFISFSLQLIVGISSIVFFIRKLLKLDF